MARLPVPEEHAGDAPTATALVELLDLAFDAIFVRQFHDRTITYWNRGAEELYGWTREEAVGRIPADILQTRYPISLEDIEWELLATGRWQGELIQQSRAGNQIIVSGRWVLRRDQADNPIEILEINGQTVSATFKGRVVGRWGSNCDAADQRHPTFRHRPRLLPLSTGGQR